MSSRGQQDKGSRRLSSFLPNVLRSKSFGGLVQNNKHVTPAYNPPAPDHLWSPVGDNVMMDSCRVGGGKGRNTLGGGGGSVKVPKQPRPDRCRVVMQCMVQALRESILLREHELHTLQRREHLTPSLSQQLKLTERHLKKLEYHLSKIEEIREQYLMQEKMLAGASQMVAAYLASGPSPSSNSLSQLRSGLRHSEREMCQLELLLESYMGTLTFNISGLVGFARLCPGDQYEILVRHGSEQKWRARCKIDGSKNGKGAAAAGSRTQVWHPTQVHTISCRLGEMLTIKATELKGLGKHIVLGSKNCDTTELFAAHQQLMTINLNSTGSLKLNMFITWNPLDAYPTETRTASTISSFPHRSQPTSPLSPNSSSSFYSLPHSASPPSYMNWTLSSGSDKYSSGSTTNPLFSHDSEMVEINKHHPAAATLSGFHQTSSSTFHPPTSQMASVNGTVSGGGGRLVSGKRVLGLYTSQPLLTNATLLCLDDEEHDDRDGSEESSIDDLRIDDEFSVTANEKRVVDQGYRSEATLLEILEELSATLEDYQGQYLQLQHLEEVVRSMHTSLLPMFDRSESSSGNSSRSSSNLSLPADDEEEAALECFQFLDDIDKSLIRNGRRNTRKTKKEGHVDSGVESLTMRVEKPWRVSPDSDKGTTRHQQVERSDVTSGSSCVDVVLKQHLQLISTLLHRLGSFGPLKCTEFKALHSLALHANIIEQLLEAGERWHQNGYDRKSKITSLEHVVYDEQLTPYTCFWKEVVANQRHSILYIDRKTMISSLIYKQHVSKEVGVEFTNQIMESDSSKMVTFHLYLEWCRDKSVGSVAVYLEKLSVDMGHVKILEDYISRHEKGRGGKVNDLMGLIHKLSRHITSMRMTAGLCKVMAVSDEKGKVHRELALHWQEIGGDVRLREKILIQLVQMLEDKNKLVRLGSCLALRYIQGSECSKKLWYIYQCDSSSAVRSAAKHALQSLGCFNEVNIGGNSYKRNTFGSHVGLFL